MKKIQYVYGHSPHINLTSIQSFAEWIHRQRTTIAAYNKSSKPNANLEERKKRLEDIGFVFTVQYVCILRRVDVPVSNLIVPAMIDGCTSTVS